jgi:hypothetical protein
MNHHDQIQGENPIGSAFRAISRKVNPPLRFLLENQGHIHPSWASRLRSADVDELDRLAFEHRFNEHIGQGIIGGQSWVSRFDQPIKQPFSREQLSVQSDPCEILAFAISDIFMPRSLSGAVGHWLPMPKILF